jgi:hypothetical protein
LRFVDLCVSNWSVAISDSINFFHGKPPIVPEQAVLPPVDGATMKWFSPQQVCQRQSTLFARALMNEAAEMRRFLVAIRQMHEWSISHFIMPNREFYPQLRE